MSETSLRDESEGWGMPATFGPIPFDAFRAELLALYEPPLRARKTYVKLRLTLDRVAELLGPGATTAGLTPAFIARLVASRPPRESTHTTKGRLNNVRTACSYAVQMGYLRFSPFAVRKSWLKVGEPARKKHHSIEDIARVLSLLAGEVRDREGWARWRARRLQALAATVAYTGLRAGEAIGPEGMGFPRRRDRRARVGG